MASAKPVYERPTGVQVAFGDAHSAEVVWRGAAYANYYVLQLARNDEFEHAHLQSEGDSPNVNAYTVDELEAGTKYWVRVAVCNWEGQRLSPWSAARTFRTAP